MSLEEIRQGILRAAAELQRELSAEALRAGADAAALVEDRIVMRGEKADGGALTPYSTKPAPAFYYLGRSRNNAGEAAVKARAKKRQSISYREFRQLNGLGVDHKSLDFTGAMWQGFGVKRVSVLRLGVVQVEIGGKNEYTGKLLGYHSAREKTEITAPSAQEIRLISAGIKDRLQSIIAKNV